MKSFFIIALGNLLLTGTYAFFTIPNNIIDGGVTSTSFILSQFFHIDIVFVILFMTISLLIFGLITLGKDFFVRSVFSSLCYMIFFTIFHLTEISISVPPLLCVLFAGIIIGFGHYLCLSQGSSTIGYDVIALFLHKKRASLDTAIVLRVISFFILIIGIIDFGFLSVLYGIFFILIQTQIIYQLSHRNKSKKKEKAIC